MRTKQEMFELLIDIAKKDKRIRAAYLAGSRVNPNAPKDIFQDYDVVYAVAETSSFIRDRTWIDRFGERLYMQHPDESVYDRSDQERCYGWLMQFADGNRLDLHVCTLDYLPESLANDRMYKVLLDKEGCLPKQDKKSDEDFWIPKFTNREFLCTCNEFWWCMNNVAKGLWREEVLYVMDMLNICVRPMLTRVLEFKIGLETNFMVSVGKSSKYMKKWVSPEIWEKYLHTYSIAEVNEMWSSVFLMCDLFHTVALEVSVKSGFTYDCIEAKNSRSYLEHVYKLPKEAKSVY